MTEVQALDDHAVRLYTFSFWCDVEKDRDTLSALMSRMADHNASVLEARIVKRMYKSSELILRVRRNVDATTFEITATQELHTPVVVAAYMKTGRLAYLSEIPYTLAEMLSEPPLIVLQKKPRQIDS